MTRTRRQPAPALPPHSPELERAILGALLEAPERAAERVARLTPADFYLAETRLVFEAICALAQAGRLPKTEAVFGWLRENSKLPNGQFAAVISGLVDQAGVFDGDLPSIKDKSRRRELLRLSGEAERLARDEAKPIDGAAADFVRYVASLANWGGNRKLTVRQPNELLAMQFNDGDRLLGDRLLAKGQSMVIAGAAGVGKSRLLLQLAVATITGREFLGFATHGAELRWLILQTENSNYRLQADLNALRAWVSEAAWRSVNERLYVHTLDHDGDGLLGLGDETNVHRIGELIADLSPDVIGCDPLNALAVGDLNSDADMRETLTRTSQIAKAGNPQRVLVLLHHALTGRLGAARATGFDRSSFARNSKALLAWTRAQINVAPGAPDSNESLVVSCGKNSNGKEFCPFGIRLDPQLMIYTPDPSFDLDAWRGEVNGKRDAEPLVTVDLVTSLCKGKLSRRDLVKAVMHETGCAQSLAYRKIDQAAKARRIQRNPTDGTYLTL